MWGRRCNQETLLTFRDPLHFLQQDSRGLLGASQSTPVNLPKFG